MFVKKLAGLASKFTRPLFNFSEAPKQSKKAVKSEGTNTDTIAKSGQISQVIGAVVDVQFEGG
jgi:hypothetical protein